LKHGIFILFFVFATTGGAFTEILLTNAGVPATQLIYSFGAHPNREIIDRINGGIVDLWFIDYTSARWLLKSYGYDSHAYTIVHGIAESSGYFFAFSKAVPDCSIPGLRGRGDPVIGFSGYCYSISGGGDPSLRIGFKIT